MRKTSLIALLLIAALLLSYWWLRSADRSASARVHAISGAVSVRCGEQESTPITVERDIDPGCTVSTQAQSTAALTLPDASEVELKPLTEFKVEVLRRTKEHLEATMRLVEGALRASVPAASGSGFQILTVTATIGIRGTVFSVRYESAQQRTAVDVEEGRVGVTPTNPSLPAVTLEANQHIEVEPGRVSPIVRIPPAFSYLGCFRDQGDPAGTAGRDLSGVIVNDPGMTTAMCVQRCQAGGFAYAGTQYTSFCFCGNQYGASGRAENCNMACAGNPDETCGGAWANSVYSTGTPPMAEISRPSSDLEIDIDRPGMDIRNFDLPAPQPELCRQACVDEPNCLAFTYVKPGVQGPGARCWLKNPVPAPVSSDCCVSGLK